MTYTLPLPPALTSQGWKVKIRNLERLEPPHVTIMRATRAWRFGLRDLRFLDRSPAPTEVADEVMVAIRQHIDVLRGEWDRMYPENPIASAHNGD